LDSAQIKSTNNRGTFDPENPNIYYQSKTLESQRAYSGAEFNPEQLTIFDDPMMAEGDEQDVATKGVDISNDPRLDSLLSGGSINMSDNDSVSQAIVKYLNEYGDQGASSFNIVGKTANSDSDMAALFESIRSPSVERFAWAIVDETGKVVHSGLYSIGSLGATMAPSSDDYTKIVNLAKDVGGEIFVAHNHPSEDLTPSEDDGIIYNNLANWSAASGVNTHGLILDHDHAVYWNQGKGFHAAMPYQGGRKFDVKQSLEGAALLAPESIADLFSKVYLEGEPILLVHTNNKGHLQGLETVDDLTPTTARNSRQALVANRTFVILPESKRDQKDIIKDNKVADVFVADGNGAALSLRRTGGYFPAMVDLDEDIIPNEVNERATRYKPVRFGGFTTLLTDPEKAKFKKGLTDKFLDVFKSLPSDIDFAEAAKAGAAKKGWYKQSSDALIGVFGEVDAPRFSALLAATSPQTSVESNLANALRIWINWNKAGEPTADGLAEMMNTAGTAALLKREDGEAAFIKKGGR
jgi:hypothetical protein